MNSRGNREKAKRDQEEQHFPLPVDGFVVRVIVSWNFLQEILASGISSRMVPSIKLR